jgi:hypothetical protein
MTLIKSRSFAVLVSIVALAAVLGGSLGIAAAGPRTQLTTGFNLVGGPLTGAVSPEKFTSCLPSNSWTSVYLWDRNTQEWKHYFNTTLGVPAFINGADAGGLVIVPRLEGVAMMMAAPVASPFFPDSPNQSCP